MGKKGNWINALKKAFTTNPKEKPTTLVAQYSQPPPQYRSERDKKRWGGFGRSRQQADPAPAMMSIPLYRQPSSIEKILGDAEMERQYYGRPPAQYQITPARPTTVTAAATAPTTPLARERERERDGNKQQQRERDGNKQQHAAAVQPLPPPPSCSPPPLIRRFDHDREQQQRLQRLQQGRAAEKITEWRQPQQQQRPRTSAAATRRRAVPPEQAHAAAVAIQAAFRGYSARRSYRSLRGLIRLQGVVRGPNVRRQTAQAMRCMRTLVRVQAQVRASRVEAMERRNLHGAMFRDGRSRGGPQVRWRRVGRQPAEPGRGGREDEAKGGGRDEAGASARVRLLSPGAEGNTHGGARDPGGPPVGPEPVVVGSHRPQPRGARANAPRRARRHPAQARARRRAPRDDEQDDANDDVGHDAGAVGGVGILPQAAHQQARHAGGHQRGAEPRRRRRRQRPRRREPDELPVVRRAKLHDAHGVGVGKGPGARAGVAAAAGEGAASGGAEAPVLVRARAEHRELGQEPVLEGRRWRRAVGAVVEGRHAGGVRGWRQAAPEVRQRAQRRLHRVHAGRGRQEDVQVLNLCLVDRCNSLYRV